MTARQRAALLALPDDEAAIVKHYSLSDEDMAAIDTARTPATRLGYALQLCCLRYPGRHLRQGELLPAVMLDHIAEQVGVDANVIADFARRTPTRYDQLAAIKTRFGFSDLSRPHRVALRTWLTSEAATIIDGRALLGRLLDEMRARRIVIPGVSVVERMAAEAINQAETDLVTAIDGGLGAEMRQRLDALIDDKVHDRQSRLSWLREPEPRVASASLLEIVEKITVIRGTGISACSPDARHEPRLAQFAREGVRYTAQAFQQMRPARRRVVLLATLRELEATLTDAAIDMFIALVGRAHLRARKRLEQRVAVSGREGANGCCASQGFWKQSATRPGRAVMSRRRSVSWHPSTSSTRTPRSSGVPPPHRDEVLDEIAVEYRAFKRMGPCSCALSISKAAPGCRRCARRWRSSPISTGTGAGRCPTMCQQAISSAAGVAMS
jgi:hypothetical protein